MGKTRDLFKKTRDTKGTFHAKMGTIMDRNGMDLIEAEDIKKSWQEYTEEIYRKDLHDLDNHDGVITHLECYNEHWGTRVSFDSGFISVCDQQWDCRVVWQFYFQFFKESPHRSP